MENRYWKDSTAKLLFLTPISLGEIGGRTCYDSFDKSKYLQDFKEDFIAPQYLFMQDSPFLEQMSHVNFHTSLLEHINATWFIETSRGVLQELVRSRIGVGYSFRSTRYTMSDILKAFIWFVKYHPYVYKTSFISWLGEQNIFLVNNQEIEAKLLVNEFIEYGSSGVFTIKQIEDDVLSKEARKLYEGGCTLEELLNAKDKRNAGDNYKLLVKDTWRVEGTVTMNMRAFKHFYSLRNSGAAWNEIQVLAKAMYDTLPVGYQRLIVKH